MFESIVIRRLQSSTGPFDIGQLAEILLFYGKAHLHLEDGGLAHLLRELGSDQLQMLVDNNYVDITYFNQGLGVRSTQTAPFIHSFCSYSFAGTNEGGIFKNKNEKFQNIFERALGKSVTTKKAAGKLLTSISEDDYSSKYEHDEGIAGLANEDLSDQAYIRNAIKIALNELVPNYKLPPSWLFNIYKVSDGFAIDSDLDFVEINSEYHKLVSPEHSSITPAYLADFLLRARADICIASKYESDFATTSVSSRIMRAKFANLLGNRYTNANEIELFQEFYLDDAHAIRDALNSGEKNFADFIGILEKSTKFKNWLQSVDAEEKLVREYYKSVTSDTWVEKLPTKGTRFGIFTGAGLLIDILATGGIATAGGLALGAADSLILDSFIKGWRPNHFVDGPLTKFIGD